MTPKKKYKTVDEAAWYAAKKAKVRGPEYDIPQPDDNPFGYATKLNKAKGSPKTHNDGIKPMPKKKTIKKPNSTATKSFSKIKQTGYLA